MKIWNQDYWHRIQNMSSPRWLLLRYLIFTETVNSLLSDWPATIYLLITFVHAGEVKQSKTQSYHFRLFRLINKNSIFTMNDYMQNMMPYYRLVQNWVIITLIEKKTSSTYQIPSGTNLDDNTNRISQLILKSKSWNNTSQLTVIHFDGLL